MTQRQADALLVLIAIIWGTTFTVVHSAVESYPPFALIALRFGLAALVFAPMLYRRRAALNRRAIGVGALLGTLLLLGFATQTLGLQYTTPARAGFITGLNVVLVPVLGLVLGLWPPPRALLGVGVAMIGLLILFFGCRLPWLNCAVDPTAVAGRWLGDLLVLACAFAFAMHIVAVSRWATALPVVPVNAFQLVVVTALAAGASLLFERPLSMPTAPVWAAGLFLGVIATALVFALQLHVQRYTTATHTGLIFALEPVFAAFFSWWWTGEALTGAIWIGGGLMLLGVILAELPARRAPRRRRSTAAIDAAMADGEA